MKHTSEISPEQDARSAATASPLHPWSGERRLFLGLAVPTDVKQALAPHLATLPHPWQAVALSNLHVTLRFLGASSYAQAEQLCQLIAKQPHPRCQLALDTLDYWPGPKILCLAGQVQDSALRALDAMLDDAALCCGFSPRQHPLRPHITLARKAPATLPLALLPQAWTADTLHLYHSERTEAGLCYRPIASWPLT